MSNIHKESLELMEVFLKSISDNMFLEDYCSVEESKGVLVKDFLMPHNDSLPAEQNDEINFIHKFS